MMQDHRDDLVISYYRVRQVLGYAGLSLPIFLVVGGLLSLGGIEPSISDYYHTVLRDIFVGIMTAIGLFLIAYPGHHRTDQDRLSDDRITTLAGIAAIGVAFFPNEYHVKSEAFESPLQMWLGHTHASWGHYGSAIVFLFLLGLLCHNRFARTAKPWRRRIYRACGKVIWAMTLGVIIASYFKIRGPAGPQAVVNDYYLVLWFEAVAIWAFAVSWLTKGRAELALARIGAHLRPAKAPAGE